MLPPQLLMCFPRQSSLKLAVSVDVRACTHQSKGLDASNIVRSTCIMSMWLAMQGIEI